jgi:predicted GNAT superfamily acetyltransferase
MDVFAKVNGLAGATIRAASTEDLPELLICNEASIPHVSTLTKIGLRKLFDQAAWFPMVQVEGKIAGFLLALDHRANYASENYSWFVRHYERFLYIDRIIIAAGFRQRGLGTWLYEELESLALSKGFLLLSCEVNLKPANIPSLEFHHKKGFLEVGTQMTESATKLVSLRIKSIQPKGIRTAARV